MVTLSGDKSRILIVDDEKVVRDLLAEILAEFSPVTAESVETALLTLEKETFDLVISDINLGDASGIELIPKVLKSSPDTAVMMISGNQTIDNAIEAMREGAFDFIKKPFEIEHIEIAVRRALNHHSLLKTKRLYESDLEELVKHRTDQLNYLAYHDSLTDLPNRILFEDRFTQTLKFAEKDRRNGLILLCLDKFKEIQDTLGFAAGKEILQETSLRLKKNAGQNATVARFEADEFALLLPNVGDVREITDMLGNLGEAIKQPIVFEGSEIFMTASAGVTVSLDKADDVQTLLRNTGVALSRAIEQGGDTYCFYTNDLDAEAVRRLSLKNNLRRALEREEFVLYYQPKIDVSTKNIVGMEALVRWQHPKLGLISPAEFIPLAEDTGMIVPIGEWILRTACARNKIWQDEGFDLSLAVNLSARQFQQPNLTRTILEIIKETGLNPLNLNLEVTESAIMKNSDSAVAILNELKRSGVKISIDDFGTGYSSLGYLKHLPIDTLKIDKSFVQDVTTDPNDAALVMAIVTLAHNLRLKVVAEGVETEEQLRFLYLLRCDEYQGYYFSKPVGADDFRKLLE